MLKSFLYAVLKVHPSNTVGSSWLERRPVTAEVEFRVSSGSLWDRDSAGEHLPLQAEGHRFEPYWSHYNLKVVSYIEYG